MSGQRRIGFVDVAESEGGEGHPISVATERVIRSPYPPVTVIWEDIDAPSEHWSSLSEVKNRPQPTMMTRGFLVDESESRVVVASTFDTNDPDTLGDVNIIPRSVIVGFSLEGDEGEKTPP